MDELFHLVQPEHPIPRLVKLSPNHLIPPGIASAQIIAIVEDCKTGEQIPVRKFVDTLTPLEE